MNNHDHRQAAQNQIMQASGYIPNAPDGPLLDSFKALDLAQAIESEVNRAKENGLRKIRVDMDHFNAIAMASYLRRAVARGV